MICGKNFERIIFNNIFSFFIEKLFFSGKINKMSDSAKFLIMKYLLRQILNTTWELYYKLTYDHLDIALKKAKNNYCFFANLIILHRSTFNNKIQNFRPIHLDHMMPFMIRSSTVLFTLS